MRSAQTMLAFGAVFDEFYPLFSFSLLIFSRSLRGKGNFIPSTNVETNSLQINKQQFSSQQSVSYHKQPTS